MKSVSSLDSSMSVGGGGGGVLDEEPLVEASDVPLDGRLFLSVALTHTEVHTEAGGPQYTMYTIQVSVLRSRYNVNLEAYHTCHAYDS